MCRVLVILVDAGKLWTRQRMSVSSQYYLDMTYNPATIIYTIIIIYTGIYLSLSAITYDQFEFFVQSANNDG